MVRNLSSPTSFIILLAGLFCASLISFFFGSTHLMLLLLAAVVLLVITVGFFGIKQFPLLLFGGIIVGQVARFRLSGDSSGSLLLLDLLMAGYVALGGTYALITRQKIPLPLSLIFLVAFLGWIPLSLLFGSSLLAPSELLIALFYAVRLFLVWGGLVVTLTLFRHENQQQKLIRGLLATGLIVTLLGYLQLIIFPNFAFMAKLGWDPHVGRLLSTFFDPNFFGMFLVMMLTLVMSFLFFRPDVTGRLWLWGLLLVLLAALGLTFSRSSYLAFLISLTIILFLRAWKMVLVVALVLIFVVAAVPRVKQRVMGAFEVDTTAQDRIESWRESFVIIRDHPIVGVGYNAFGPTQIHYGLRKDLLGHSSRGSDSSLLLTLATTGVIGLTAFILFFGSLFYEALLVYRRAKSPFFQAMGLATLAIIPAYLVHSQFVNGLYYPLLVIPFTFIIAPVLSGLPYLKAKG